jgi:hypothetical protein
MLLRTFVAPPHGELARRLAVVRVLPGLSAKERTVLAALIAGADASGVCWSGPQFVSRKTGLRLQDVGVSLARLRDRGVLHKRPVGLSDRTGVIHVLDLDLLDLAAAAAR